MRHWRYLFALLAALGLAGCGGPVGRREADDLAAWLGRQPFSVWSTFRHRGTSQERPPSPDGLTLGSPNVFAAVGCDPDDLSQLTVLWGDARTARAVAKPITTSASTNLLGEKSLQDFTSQTLSRIRHTAVSVSEAEEGGLSVRAVDFAPMGAEDNFLVRWLLVENRGTATQSVTLSLHLTGGGDWRKVSGSVYELGDKLAVLSDQSFEVGENTITVPMGRIGAGARAAAALFFVVAQDRARLEKGVARASSMRRDPMALLQQTATEWTEWCAKTPLQSGDERTDDLLDSLLCLVRSHVGGKAIHTGSLRYPHDRAWVRDDYWVQRALFELGLTQEAKVGLDFFHRAWQAGGLASSYQTRDGRPVPYGHAGVELPHYLVLMVRDAEQYGRANGKDYWDMVRGCLDKVAFPESGLQPMNGDESWILAAPVRELDDLLDNSWLFIASAEYGSRLAQRAGDAERAARYGSMAYKARLALRDFMPREGEADWLGIGKSGDGSLDLSLCPEVYARGAIFGILPATEPHLAAGLVTGWERLKFARGLRTHARSATINGGTPGYVLYAMSENPGCDALFRRELIAGVERFASATGNVWEYHDVLDPAWGGEKRRLWDSAVLLLGMTHALFDVQRGDAETTYFIPKPEPVSLSLPPEETPGYDAGELISGGGGLILLQQQSPEHAAHIARELLRQCNRKFPIASFGMEPPDNQPAIIISPDDPPTGWLRTQSGYYTRAWGGPPQLWVKNQGHVFNDTEPLLLDLYSYLTPQRETPLPFPDANYDLVARCGETPAGQAQVEGYWSGPYVTKTLDLANGSTDLKLGKTTLRLQAYPHPEKRRLLRLGLSGARPEPVEVSVTLPAGYWLVYARDMSGKWDRAADPAHEERLPDGRLRLSYSLRASDQPFDVTFDLARLGVS